MKEYLCPPKKVLLLFLPAQLLLLLYTSTNRLVLNNTALQELNLKMEDVRCTFVYTDSTDGKVGDGPVVELEGEEMDLNPRNLSLFATCNHKN